MDEEEYEKLRTASAYGDYWQGYYSLPIPTGTENPWFFNMWGLDPSTHVLPSVVDGLEKVPGVGESIPPMLGFDPTDASSVRASRDFARRNLFAGKALELVTGQDVFGRQQGFGKWLYNTATDLTVPGLFKRPLENARRKAMGQTRKTALQSLLDSFGIRFREGKPQDILTSEIRQLEAKGKIKRGGAPRIVTNEFDFDTVLRLRMYNQQQRIRRLIEQGK